MAKKKRSSNRPKKKAAPRKAAPRKAGGSGGAAPDATGKHLVIVESPTKAKTINKYLGSDYVVLASVGHIRDLPPRNPKGVKNPVPGVDLENDFEPTYEVLKEKDKTVRELRKAAKQAEDVWFATDLDREGEAIAWHLVHALNYPEANAKRVVFNAITKAEIEKAFSHPRPIDDNRVDAQQARRILDRIVGYQVSPLLWKKVAGGLSAGRVQSVGARLVVDREREIEAFIPDEYWKITGIFSADPAKADALAETWRQWIGTSEEENPRNPRTLKDQVSWLTQHEAVKAELVEVAGKPFKPTQRDEALKLAQSLGFALEDTNAWDDEDAKGPQQNRCEYLGQVDHSTAAKYTISSIETKRTKARPSPPFITSTLQQQASTRLGFNLKRTMRIAQQLYEGINLGGVQGQTGLITYMRTDSTHLSDEALTMARSYIAALGDEYLPAKANFYKSSNQSAQEAHEAVRPTDARLKPSDIRGKLTDEQFRLYDLIWRRFLASQMTPAESDSTTITIAAPSDQGEAKFRASGRRIVFDGFYKIMGAPSGDVILPHMAEGQEVGAVHLDPTQHFTSPPARYTEASLQKKLEEEGIGRPSTYAAIIGTIQDRKYVQPLSPRDRRLYATDLGKVVTDMLIEAFPKVMDISYTREMEAELDKIESEHHDWRKMLHDFYGPFKDNLEHAMENMQHAKAVTEPAPYKCDDCGSPTMYRFGRNGRFLSCSRYPDCKFAAPIDRNGKPMQPQQTDIQCPACQGMMTKRVGRFGPFLGCVNYPECKGIVKIDPKKGYVVLPKAPPMTSDELCPKCESPLYVRDSKRGLWLSCSTFPKCRGRVGFSKIDEEKQKIIEAAWVEHLKENPIPQVKTNSGRVLIEGDEYLPVIAEEESSEPADAA